MKILRANARATRQQPATSFTGVVYADEIVVGEKPSRMRATRVSFTPGARTNWHTHPVGQVLFCLSGIGRYQEEGEGVVELRPGDTVIIAPDKRHWHGAAPELVVFAPRHVGERRQGWWHDLAGAGFGRRLHEEADRWRVAWSLA